MFKFADRVKIASLGMSGVSNLSAVSMLLAVNMLLDPLSS